MTSTLITKNILRIKITNIFESIKRWRVLGKLVDHAVQTSTSIVLRYCACSGDTVMTMQVAFETGVRQWRGDVLKRRSLVCMNWRISQKQFWSPSTELKYLILACRSAALVLGTRIETTSFATFKCHLQRRG